MRGLDQIAKTVDALVVLVNVILFFIFIGSACWHGIVFYKSYRENKIEMTGVFKERPTPGYVWQEDSTENIRLFWKNTDITWKAGIANPGYENVISADQEGYWEPRAGYIFIDRSKSLEVRWKAGIRLRDYKVISSDQEGYWKALPGYVLIDSHSFATTWKAGLKDSIGHPNMVSGENEGSWYAIIDSAKIKKDSIALANDPWRGLFSNETDTAKKQ